VVATVAFPVPREVAFDYLVDPRNRPQWQSSLRRVDRVDGAPRVGQTWVDVTTPGLRPAMTTTELDRPGRWAETGTWRGFAAELALDLAEVPGQPGRCTATFALSLTGRGGRAPVAWLLGRLAPYAVRSDLRRAARVLSRRSVTGE
jgi:uncharacterized protein YndB with AHSA1/START domain